MSPEEGRVWREMFMRLRELVVVCEGADFLPRVLLTILVQHCTGDADLINRLVDEAEEDLEERMRKYREEVDGNT